jgi:ATP-dependent protease ClpP protease subunit
MAKKLSLIAPMYGFVIDELVKEILAVNDGEDIILYQNSPGGSVFAGWALAGVMKEHNGNITIKAFGNSSSMGFYNLLYADRVEALDVTRFTVHRADGYIESDDDRKLLDDINKDLRSAMESKIDEDKFIKITGKTFNDIFNPETRIDVTLSAKDLKKLGVVDKIIKLSDKEQKAISTQFAAFSDIFESCGNDENTRGSDNYEKKVSANKINTNKKNSKEMDLTKLKAEHPTVYAQVIALGITEGVEAEQKRVKAIMAFNAIDPEGCIKAVNDGTEADMTFIAEMAAKAASPRALADAQEDSPVEIEAKKKEEEATKTKNQEELEAFAKEVNRAAGIIEEVK